jgi:hypothetical protein
LQEFNRSDPRINSVNPIRQAKLRPTAATGTIYDNNLIVQKTRSAGAQAAANPRMLLSAF